MQQPNDDIIQYERDEPYLRDFLATIKKHDGTFKRVLSSPLRYPGGKTKAIGIILDNLPKLRSKKIVSPFFGGGSFELCASQSLGIEVVGYDIFGMLTNFWNVLITRKQEFIDELKKFAVTSEEFTRNRHILLSYWDTIKPADLHYHTKKVVELSDEEKNRLSDNELQQAVYYYYNMTLSYGPMFLGWPSSNEINKDKFNRRITKLSASTFSNLRVSCKDFKEVIQSHPDDFLFLDPPYYLGEDSTMFKGMYPNCNFAIHHKGFDHVEMARLLSDHKGGFLITYNDCPTIRELYKNHKQIFPEWQYTYGQGETRIGKNRNCVSSNTDTTTNVDNAVLLQTTPQHVKKSSELFIICPPSTLCG
jgi:DNA adenine methylase